jgi:hypothetical protein
MAATLDRWQRDLDALDRVPQGCEQAMERQPHERVLRGAGLDHEGRFEFALVQRWSAESLVGFVYSTSFLNRAVLGRHADAFDRDLRARLLAAAPDGVFEEDATFAYELARRPL